MESRPYRRRASTSWSSRMLPSASITNHRHKRVCTRASSPWVSRGEPPHPESKAMVTRYPIRDTGYIVCSILAFGEHLRCDGHLRTIPACIQGEIQGPLHIGKVTNPCRQLLSPQAPPYPSHAPAKVSYVFYTGQPWRARGRDRIYPLPKKKVG